MCVLHGLCLCTWRPCVGVCDWEGFVPWGTPQIPALTAKPEVAFAPPLRVLGAGGCFAGEAKPWCTVSRANVQQRKWGFASYLCISLSRCRSQASPGALPASRPAPCRIHPAPPSLSPGATASTPSPALRKGTPHRGHTMFIRNKMQRAGLLWQVCHKYWLERGGHLASGDYTLLPRETLPRPVQALPQPSKRCQ